MVPDEKEAKPAKPETPKVAEKMPTIGDTVTLKVTKVSTGKDGSPYVTVATPGGKSASLKWA